MEDIYSCHYIHSDNWMELSIDENFVKRIEEPDKKEKQPTFDQYPMFEWAKVIPTMYNTKEDKDRESNEENSEGKLI